MAMDMTTALTIKANVVGQNQLGGLTKGLGRVAGQSNKTATAMGRLKSAAGGALGAMRNFLPVIGVAGIAAFAKKNLDTADSMSKLSQRTGIAAPTLDKFRKVAELSDTSIGSLERAFPALTKNMDMAAQKGKGPAFEAFERLGISVKNADGSLRDADSVMLDIADRFMNMKDGSEKAALASAVFGTRIGSELIPFLNSGGDAVRDMSTALTQDFADRAATFNDRIENLGEKFGDLGVKLTEALLPVLERLVGFIEGLVTAFTNLPGPLQGIIGGFTALGAALIVIGPAIPGIVLAFKGLAALKLGATIAGWAAVIPTIGTALSGLLPIIAGVFTGPVGWAALLVGAGAAIYAFRDQIGEVFSGLGQFFAPAIEAFTTTFVDPLVQGATQVFDFFRDNFGQFFQIITTPFQEAIGFINSTFIEPISSAISTVIETIRTNWSALQQGLISPFEAAANTIKGIFNAVLGTVESVVNNVINAINKKIQGVNNLSSKVGIPAIPTIPNIEIPKLAKGGMVNGAQLALIGEAGPEYVVPAGKAQGFARNILSGVTGPSAIPRMAEGGYVGPVNITTGPVMQQGGTNYVTMAQFEAGVRDVAAAVTRGRRSYGARKYAGVS